MSWDEVNNQFKGFEKKLSELYEYWCYFKLLKVLNDLSVKKINFEDYDSIFKYLELALVIEDEHYIRDIKFYLYLYYLYNQ